MGFQKGHIINKGRKPTNAFSKGIIPWNKGKTNIYSEETKKSMGADKIGKIPWDKGMKGIHFSPKTELKKGHQLNKGKKFTEEHIQNNANARRGKYIKERNKNWKGGAVASNARKHNKRRQFGYIPLNSYHNGYVGHHIDIEYIVYIPIKLHRGIPHNLKKPKTMVRINWIAIYYLNPAIVPIPNEAAARAKEILQSRIKESHETPYPSTGHDATIATPKH